MCFNEDIEYDFGGHIWAGRISWLRQAWKHIPLTLDNCEDFWLSATLKTFYNISIKTSKCPCPKDWRKNSKAFHRSKIIKAISINLKYKSFFIVRFKNPA